MEKEKVLIALLFEEMAQGGTIIQGVCEETGERYNDMERVIGEILEDQQAYSKISDKLFNLFQEEIEFYIKRMEEEAKLSTIDPTHNGKGKYYAIFSGNCIPCQTLEQAQECFKEIPDTTILDEQFQVVEL